MAIHYEEWMDDEQFKDDGNEGGGRTFAKASDLPDGYYDATILDVEETEMGYKLKLAIAGGKYDGVWVWDRLNIHHDNPKVAAIASKTFVRLRDMAISAGLCKPKQDILLDSMTVRVKIKQNGQYTNISWYGQPNGAPSAPATPVKQAPKEEPDAEDDIPF